MSVIDELQGYLLDNPPQLDNMWEFTVKSSMFSTFEENMHFMVSDVSIPFPKLTYETAANGEKYYTGVSFPDEFQVTIKETHDPASRSIVGSSSKVLSWWNEWINLNYDFEAGKFVGYVNSNDSHRTGILRLFSDDVVVPFVAVTPVMRAVIFDNVLLSIARGVASRALGITGVTDTLNIVSNATGRDINATIKPITTPFPLGTAVETASETKVTAEFKLINLKPVGIEPVSLTYSDGKPMEYRLSLTCDRLEFTGL